MPIHSSERTFTDARLAAIVNSSFDAIIGKDLNSIITDWNPAAERLFGYSPTEALGQDIRIIIPEPLVSEEDEIIRRIRARQQVDSFETTRRRKDGSLLEVSLTVSPVICGDRLIGASKIARDITEARRNEKKVRFLLQEINHRIKNQYAVILSLAREAGKRSVSTNDFLEELNDRIMALAASNDLLVQQEWSGLPLRDLINAQLSPYGATEDIEVSGPELILAPHAVQSIGMAFHELGTNSAKHGVLSGHPGHIQIDWHRSGEDDDQLVLAWVERFDEPMPSLDGSQRGLGSVILSSVTPSDLGGHASLRHNQASVIWRLTAPADIVLAKPDQIELPLRDHTVID